MHARILSFARLRGPDALSGLLVSLIALPLCLGIAMASGFPPVAGLLTAIVGGLVVSFVGHADLTIKGPAAGLIVIVLGAVTELGAGDAMLGYRRTLAVCFVAAVLQIGLGLMRAGVLGQLVPSAVVKGMLSAIGIIILTKQLPVMLGSEASSGSPVQVLLDLPATVASANPAVLAIGVGSLLLLALLPRVERLQRIPAPMVVLACSLPLAASLGVSGEHLVLLPASLLDAVTFPDFSAVWSPTSLKYIGMLAVVGSIESLLSVLAVDAMDPRPGSSDLDKDLLATGIGNLLCACIGGLPMISEIVRSRANLDAGAKSRWSNAFHGLCLLVAVALVPGLIEQVPLAALAAMLVYTGARLASPREFLDAWRFGRGQMTVFLVTIVATLATDLLVGVVAGLLVELALHVANGVSPGALFRAPAKVEQDGDRLVVRVEGPAAFTNLLHVTRLLDPGEAREVVVDASNAQLVDRTVLERIAAAASGWRDVTLTWVGLDTLKPSGQDPMSTRRRLLAK